MPSKVRVFLTIDSTRAIGWRARVLLERCRVQHEIPVPRVVGPTWKQMFAVFDQLPVARKRLVVIREPRHARSKKSQYVEYSKKYGLSRRIFTKKGLAAKRRADIQRESVLIARVQERNRANDINRRTPQLDGLSAPGRARRPVTAGRAGQERNIVLGEVRVPAFRPRPEPPAPVQTVEQIFTTTVTNPFNLDWRAFDTNDE
jgi:hypothetical protein